MIVAFSGAHSCGKSTLVEFFRGKEGYICIDSCTRSTISAEERKVDGVTDLGSAQIKMLDNVTKRMAGIVKMNVEDPTKIYLMDRSCLDFIAYSRVFARKGLLSKYYLEQIEKGCKDLWRYIDVIFYLPIEFPIVSDGVRSEDEALRKEVDMEILNQLLWNGSKSVKLTGPVLSRVLLVEKTIDLLKHEHKNI